VRNPADVGKREAIVQVDGRDTGDAIPLIDDGAAHNVEVRPRG
jgi:hypothetical protein